jgi:hypothetical protein
MTAEAPVTGWADPVTTFLSANIPRETETSADEGRLGWDHMFSSSHQIGCMALIALGEAIEEGRGASPRTPPVRPDVRPRWDDVAVAVLWLAEQQNKLQWRLPDGSVRPQRTGQFVVRVINAPRPPPPNIAAAHHCHPARASVEVMEVLSALGLIKEGVWTKAAELVIWRCGASASAATVETDRRFTAAIKTCIATMPPDIRADLSSLTIIAHTDLASERDRWQAQLADLATRYPRNPAHAHPTDEGLRRELASRRANEANWLFFRRWRLPDGWLSPSDATRALEVFHDPLAIAMRRAVVERLFPGSDLAIAHPFTKVMR